MNRVSGGILIVLSLVALLAVVSGYIEPPPPDEGAAAHIFQLAIWAIVPTLVVFIATANGKRPLGGLGRLAIPAATLILAFAALYYLEHHR